MSEENLTFSISHLKARAEKAEAEVERLKGEVNLNITTMNSQAWRIDELMKEVATLTAEVERLTCRLTGFDVVGKCGCRWNSAIHGATCPEHEIDGDRIQFEVEKLRNELATLTAERDRLQIILEDGAVMIQ